jgi:hypothetical protein
VASGSDLENKARFGEILEVEGRGPLFKDFLEEQIVTPIGLCMDRPSEKGSQHQCNSVSDDHRSSF